MKQLSKRFTFFTIVCLLALFLFASVALAATKYTEPKTQTVPGITQRVIVGQLQVAAYPITGVNHVGYMHFEVQFDENYDCDIYILDSLGNSLNDAEGYSAGTWGLECIDWKVTNIVNKSVGADGEVVGDTYYVVVVPFNGKTWFNVRGYAPRIWEGSGDTGTTGAFNYYNRCWPNNADNYWKFKKVSSIYGAPYGGAMDFTPTSEGSADVTLSWPVNYADGTPDSTNTAWQAYESYVYSGADWENNPVNLYPDDGVSPLVGSWTIANATPDAPGTLYSYVPSLFLYETDGLTPDEGIVTSTYKAVINYPQNLRLFTSASKVKKGSYVTLSGTYALGGVWQDTKQVVIKKKTSSGWTQVKAINTNATGNFSYKFKPSATATYQAVAAGSVVGTFEMSVSKKVTVTN